MKVVVAIDSFKGSMTSIEAGLAAKDGVLRVYDKADVEVFSIADGGEGTVESLVAGMNGRLVATKVKNPLADDIDAVYGIVNDTTAIIEMSAAAGITLIPKEKLNPMHTTTYGVGQMINDAIAKGCRKFVIGIGGSATNDGGIGMLQALGFSVNNKEGKPVAYGAEGLKEIYTIDDANVPKELGECTFNIACDVNNPLYGENGCSKIFARQKGATDEQIAEMDIWMHRYADVTKQVFPDAEPCFHGAGAAGGMGFAFLSFLNAELKPGIDLVLNLINIEESIKSADVVLTGEGKIDSQTVMGKAPIGIARLAKKYKKRVFAFAGAVLHDARVCNEEGIDAFFPIVRTPCSLDFAMDNKNARENMRDTVEQVMRVYGI